MKKSAVAVLLALTLSFATFVAGFYVGRNFNHSSIQISGISTVTDPASISDPLQATVTTVPPTLDETTRRLMAAINAATLEELDAVPNIGPKLARAIIDYRSTYGNFEKPEDITNVDGIGSKTLQHILNYFLGRLSNEDSSSG